MLMFAHMIHDGQRGYNHNNVLNETFKYDGENNFSNLALDGLNSLFVGLTVLSATSRTVPSRMKYKCEVLLRNW